MMDHQMPRHEAWRLSYRAHRYCQHLSQKELNGRVRDVLLRMLTLTPEAKIGVLPVTPEGIRWFELWTHVLEEMVIRHGPYPAGFTREIFHSEPFPDFVGQLASRAASSLERLRGQSVAIKFGKPEHMKALVERGQVRLQAASFYKRPDHNGAVRDDELALDIALHLDRQTILKVVQNPQDVPLGEISQRLDVRFKSPTDYWLYCVTTAVEPRLFVDFEAEACVVIKNPSKFTTAIERALTSRVPATAFRHGKVAYIDPLLPSAGMVDVQMSKHFRYSHQREYRFAWIPLEPQLLLSHIDIELGSIESYAELISI